ncbi:MAG: ATP-binding cassette domain-containing protein [candidate division KSB1 bacterium]|nr:ATP-binding cassette domain-containing protein [candidate division KSB1 bacterium]
MIKIENLNYHYEPARTSSTLKHLNLGIEPGERIAVMGHNGSGKTTFARCLNGLLTPSSGSISVDGLDLHDPRSLLEIRRKVGMVFQNPDNQIVSATVEREIAFGLENLGVPEQEMHQRVESMLQQFNIEKYRRHSPHKLSGGEKQRLALASVMAMQPRYLVLDEPTSLLDPANRKSICHTLQVLHSKDTELASILITQFPEEALDAHRLIIFYKGSIVHDERPATLFKNSARIRELGLEPPLLYQVKELLNKD